MLPAVTKAANELWPMKCPNCKLEVAAMVVSRSRIVGEIERAVADMDEIELIEYWRAMRTKYGQPLDTQEFLDSLRD
jgi:hypothetical protein